MAEKFVTQNDEGTAEKSSVVQSNAMATDSGNKVLNVPPLRFPEFSGEWRESSLGEMTINFSIRNKNCIDYPMYSVTNNRGFVPQSEQFEDRDMVGDDIKSYKIIHTGDFAYNPARINVGSIAKYNGDMPCMISSLYVCFRSKSGIDADWLMQFLKTPKANYYYNCNGEGGVRIYLFYPNFAKIKTAYPSITEQQKIARFLTLIDERIATQSKIIEDLELLKSAISFFIFESISAPTITLSHFIKKGKAGGTPASTNKDYYGGDIPFLSINDITKQGKYINFTERTLTQAGIENSSAWIVPKDSIIFSMYASVGLVTINAVSLATSQAMFAMILKNPKLTDFLYYFLSYFRYRHIYKYLETGTQSNINAEIVRSIPVPNLVVDNYINIGKTLSLIDNKLSIEKTTLKLLLVQKQFLLQKLFI